MNYIHNIKLAILSLLLIILSGCDSDSNNTGFPSGCGGANNLCVSALTITPNKSAVLVNGQQSYKAIATLTDDSKLDITDKVTWSVDNVAIATLEVEGSNVIATGVTDGLVTIIANYHDSNARAELLVGEISVSITPTVSTILTGMEQRYQAFATFPNGLQLDVTSQLTWQSTNTTVASISQTDNGVKVKGLTEGAVSISANYQNKSIYSQLNVVNSTLETLIIAPATTVLPKGTTKQYSAFLTTNSGDVIDVTTQVAWQVANNAIANIDDEALLSALNTGSTQIRATLVYNAKTLNASASLTVSNAQLNSIAITPVNGVFPVGKIGGYHAMGNFSDGSVIDITRVSTWTIANSNVAQIIPTGFFAGDTIALAAGKTTVSATFNNMTASTSLEITNAEIVNVSISPEEVTSPLGTKVAYSAYARYSDGSKQDITQLATWTSSNPKIVAIEFSRALSGVANSLAVGKTDVSVSFAGLNKSTSHTVSEAVIESLQIIPLNSNVPVGAEGQFTAIAHYSDKSTADVTQSANWQVDNYSVAAVIPNGAGAGYAKALKEGTTQLSVKFAEQTASTLITVSAATLESISLTPAIAETPAGTTIQYQLFGIYSDGTTHNLSTFADYQTSDNTLVTINSDGLATAHQYNEKPVIILASYNGLQTKSKLKVTAGLLDRIEVTPASQSIAIGHKGKLQARAFYSDNTSLDITPQATWSVNDGDIASVDNTQADSGTVLGLSEGTVTVTANFAGKTATNKTNVTSAVLESVTISPIKSTLVAGLSKQYTLIAQFSDHTNVDVTELSTWQSSDTNIAAIDTIGLVQSYKEGNVSITGSYQGLSSSANLSVLDILLTSLQVTPENPNEPVGSRGYFTATAFFNNGLNTDVTRSTTWSSSNTNVVSIVASGTKAGQANADEVGTATIRATYRGMTTATIATVTKAELINIVITPSTASVVQGMQYQFIATGIYSDNSYKNITNEVNWQTSDTNVANINNDGLASGEQQGTVKVTAKYQGKQAQATLVVSAPVITRLVVIPTTNTLPVGSSASYQAIAYDSTGKDYEVSNTADWRVVNQTIAHVDNTEQKGGFVTALSIGTSQIVVSFSGMTETVNVIVTPAKLTSLTISPTDITIIDGNTQTYVATAHFTDATNLVVTKESSWLSTQPLVASISSNGSAIAVTKEPGVTNIQATYLGMTTQTSLTVQEKEIDSLQIVPHVNYFSVGEQVQLTCSIIYIDLTVGDCTDEALWTIDDDTIAHIEPTGGLVTGLAVGDTRAYATYKGITSSNKDGQVSIR